MDPARRTAAALAQSLERGVAGALAAHVRLGGEVRCQSYLGHAQTFACTGGPYAPLQRLATPPPLTADHLFDVASCSKVLVTTLLAMLLVGDGKLRLDDPVARLLPLPTSPGHEPLRVWHLLTHRGGLAAWVPLYFDVPRPSALVPALAPYVARARPGSPRRYSDLGFLLLGAILEAQSGVGLDALWRARVAGPLGLSRSRMAPGRSAAGAVVATGHANVYERRMIDEPSFGLALPQAWPVRPSHAFAAWRNETLVGEVGDGNAHYAMQGVAGHAGLFATPAEATTVVRALAGPKGCAEAAALDVAEPVRQLFLRRHACGDYLGWFAADELLARGAPVDAVMMRGFTGCVVVASHASDLQLAVCSNREHVDAHGNYTNLRPLYAEVLEAFTGSGDAAGTPGPSHALGP